MLDAHRRPDGSRWTDQQLGEATGGVVTRSYVRSLVGDRTLASARSEGARVAFLTIERVHEIARALAKTLVGLATRFVTNATAHACGLCANGLLGGERKAR